MVKSMNLRSRFVEGAGDSSFRGWVAFLGRGKEKANEHICYMVLVIWTELNMIPVVKDPFLIYFKIPHRRLLDYTQYKQQISLLSFKPHIIITCYTVLQERSLLST